MRTNRKDPRGSGRVASRPRKVTPIRMSAMELRRGIAQVRGTPANLEGCNVFTVISALKSGFRHSSSGFLLN